MPVFTKMAKLKALNGKSGTAAVVMFAGCWLAGGGLEVRSDSTWAECLVHNSRHVCVDRGLACDQLRRLRNWWSSRCTPFGGLARVNDILNGWVGT